MRDAILNGRLARDGPRPPEKAVCRSCGGAVTKRKRRGSNKRVTYFYRHERGVGQDCPRRSYP
jgi:hypothetical protein